MRRTLWTFFYLRRKTALIFFAQKLLKSFDWCSPKCLNCLRYDKKNTLVELFSGKSNNIESLLQFCSGKFGWCYPNGFGTDEKNTLDVFFSEMNYSLTFFLQHRSKKTGLCSPNCLKCFYLMSRKIWRTFFFWEKPQLYHSILTGLKNFVWSSPKYFLLDKKHFVWRSSGKSVNRLILLQSCPKNWFDVPQTVFHLMRRRL